MDGVFQGEQKIVQFYFSGKGLVPSSTYYGFYYSEENTPAAFQNVSEELEPVSENEWTWSDGTDNGGMTKRIVDNWFYYEAWF